MKESLERRAQLINGRLEELMGVYTEKNAPQRDFRDLFSADIEDHGVQRTSRAAGTEFCTSVWESLSSGRTIHRAARFLCDEQQYGLEHFVRPFPNNDGRVARREPGRAARRADGGRRNRQCNLPRECRPWLHNN